MDYQMYEDLIKIMGPPQNILQGLMYQRMAATSVEEIILIENIELRLQISSIPQLVKDPSTQVRRYISQMRKTRPTTFTEKGKVE